MDREMDGRSVRGVRARLYAWRSGPARASVALLPVCPGRLEPIQLLVDVLGNTAVHKAAERGCKDQG